ncbi:MAG: hypothetical protein H6772_03810 [Pseudomonadales bacterium]|nr:hypothetical protein [Pseudomonadales bacterium]
MNKKILFSIMIFFLIFLNNIKKVDAQASLNLSVSPPISYLQVPPGSSRTHTIVLENSGENTITVLPSIVDFTTDGKTGRAIISNELSLPYISFGKTEIKELSIPANKKAQLTLYIDAPKDAKEKEYPVTILFFSKENNSVTTTQSTNSQISGAIGSNLVVLISNKTKLNQVLSILDLNTSKFVDSFGKIDFLPLVKNESIASYSASGSAKILDWRKNTLTEYEIYPDVVLGYSTRELRALRPGITNDKPETGTFSYKPKFLFGPYQIVVTLRNDQEGTTNYIEVVYAFPFSAIIIIGLGFVISAIYLKKVKSRARIT